MQVVLRDCMGTGLQDSSRSTGGLYLSQRFGLGAFAVPSGLVHQIMGLGCKSVFSSLTCVVGRASATVYRLRFLHCMGKTGNRAVNKVPTKHQRNRITSMHSRFRG